jgi:hypothetical protein
VEVDIPARHDRHGGTAASYWYDDGGDVGRLLQQFQSDRALPGDHKGVVEGGNHHEPVFVGIAAGGD